MTTPITLIASAALAAVLASGTAQAALQGRDLDGNLGSFEAYYDTVLDITWLADANYAQTSGYTDAAVSGSMTWANANTWAANLSFTDGVNTYDNWRLPTVEPVNGVSFNYNNSADGSTDSGFNISAPGTVYAGSTGSEMAHMFYNTLGNPGYWNPDGATLSGCGGIDPCLDNVGPFVNLQAGNYWSGTDYYAPDAGAAWYFSMGVGQQYLDFKNADLYAWAVSPGDVAAVPEAQTYALMLAGLGLIGWRARRRG